MWFTEYYNGCGLTVEVEEKLAESDGVQKIEIFRTKSFGKMLVLDGKIQLTEFDEKFYHEMLVHVPVFEHGGVKRALVIGGGDGGAAREVIKHDARVVVCEVDKAVVELCRKHIGIDTFDDERVEVVIEDGKEFLESCEKFDVIIVDSTDPSPVSKPLFSSEFFELATEKGDVVCCQSQSPLIQKEYFEMILKESEGMERFVYTSFVPTYPLGYWSFVIFGVKEIQTDRIYEFLEELRKKVMKIGERFEYYNPFVHVASFMHPEWLRENLKKFGVKDRFVDRFVKG